MFAVLTTATRRGKFCRAPARPVQAEALESRTLMSLGDVLNLPLVFDDIPGSASTTVVSPTVKRLDITTTSTVYVDRAGVTHNTNLDVPPSPIVTQISVLVKNDGTFFSGAPGDDL